MALLVLQDLAQAKVAIPPGSFLASLAVLELALGSPSTLVLPSVTAFTSVYSQCLFPCLPPLTPDLLLALNRIQHGDPHRGQRCSWNAFSFPSWAQVSGLSSSIFRRDDSETKEKEQRPPSTAPGEAKRTQKKPPSASFPRKYHGYEELLTAKPDPTFVEPKGM